MAQSLNKTVLVVDDEADVRAFLSAALIEAGFTVETAGDGFEALACIKEQIPDLISLDLVMPGKSGVKLHRELGKNKAWSHIPVHEVRPTLTSPSSETLPGSTHSRWLISRRRSCDPRMRSVTLSENSTRYSPQGSVDRKA